jgi:hypothetical protein
MLANRQVVPEPYRVDEVLIRPTVAPSQTTARVLPWTRAYAPMTECSAAPISWPGG